MLSRIKTFAPAFCSAALVMCVGAGCAQRPAEAARPGAAETRIGTTVATMPAVMAEQDPTTPVLAYADRVRTLASAELTQEITRLGNPTSTGDQFRLALALSQTRQLHDLVRALDLLQRILANGNEEARPLHPLARLLAARLGEQRRAEDVLDRQNQQVRDLQRRLEQTQDKLDALKEIERSLSSRPPGAPAPSPNGRARPSTP